MIAARQIFLGRDAGGGGWVNPYVTDGLVAMWDGEWNAGGGVHDANATVWKDLIGDSELSVETIWSFDNNSLYVPTWSWPNNNILVPTASTGQVDLCFSANGYVSNYGWILDGGLGLGNAKGPALSSSSASADMSAGTVVGVRYWPENELVIKRPYSYSVSNDGTVGRRITNGNISTYEVYTDSFSGVSVFNAYNYARGTTGHIYNIRHYNRALTAAEIAANCAVDKQRFNLP